MPSLLKIFFLVFIQYIQKANRGGSVYGANSLRKPVKAPGDTWNFKIS